MTPNEKKEASAERQKLDGILHEVLRRLNVHVMSGEGMTRDQVLLLRDWVVWRFR